MKLFTVYVANRNEAKRGKWNNVMQGDAIWKSAELLVEMKLFSHVMRILCEQQVHSSVTYVAHMCEEDKQNEKERKTKNHREKNGRAWMYECAFDDDRRWDKHSHLLVVLLPFEAHMNLHSNIRRPLCIHTSADRYMFHKSRHCLRTRDTSLRTEIRKRARNHNKNTIFFRSSSPSFSLNVFETVSVLLVCMRRYFCGWKYVYNLLIVERLWNQLKLFFWPFIFRSLHFFFSLLLDVFFLSFCALINF